MESKATKDANLFWQTQHITILLEAVVEDEPEIHSYQTFQPTTNATHQTQDAPSQKITLPKQTPNTM